MNGSRLVAVRPRRAPYLGLTSVRVMAPRKVHTGADEEPETSMSSSATGGGAIFGLLGV